MNESNDDIMRSDWKPGKYAAVLLSMLTILLAAGCSNGPAASDAALASVYEAYPELAGKEAETAVVVRVVDGDTFVTEDGARVRLIGINTPEIGANAEYYGAEASAYARELLEGRPVRMFRDVSDTDRYGRLLRYVFLEGDAVMVNERIVLDGYGNPATYPPDVALAERFAAAERSARSSGAGLWADKRSGDGAGTGGSDARGDEPTAESACASPEVKGNITSSGDKIYHMPGSRSYDQTKAEAWFCSEEEAKAAGFRAPR